MSIFEKEKESLLVSCLLQGNLKELYSFLLNFKINPVTVKDIKGNNALQISALNNSHSQLEFLFRFVEEKYPEASITD